MKKFLEVNRKKMKILKIFECLLKAFLKVSLKRTKSLNRKPF